MGAYLLTSNQAGADNGVMFTLAVAAVAMQPVDPHRLPIGPKGEVQVQMGYSDTSTGKASQLSEIVTAAKGVPYVLVGESHTSPAHHQAQADIILALVKAGRTVTVGFEMFTRDNQAALTALAGTAWKDEDFIAKTNWQKQWGFPYEIYKPIFDACREHKLPMVALNVPRDWVRQIGREGPGILTDEQKKWVPELYLENKEHRSVFEALMGGHPMTGPRAENIYAAQVSWDTGMAVSALDWMKANPGGTDPVMVIIAGSGHVMYSQGINWRLRRLGQVQTLDVVCIDSDGPITISKGLAPFVFVAKPPAGKDQAARTVTSRVP